MPSLTLAQIEVLLVEPSSAQQRIIQNYLHKLGIEHVDCVRTGVEAIKAMGDRLPDVVISAMHLEGMSGTELVQTMRMEDDFREVPFLLVSSETNYRYLEPIRQAGVIAILPKPFELNQLKAALKSTLQYIDPGALNTRHFNGEDLKVLVVDDSFTARRHISRVLKNMGITNLLEAENGEQALEQISQHYFDFIVTDYNMPVMNGKELTEHVRNNSSQSTIPILMVSSESDESRLAAVQQVGISAICDKPFDSSVVKKLIEQMLD